MLLHTGSPIHYTDGPLLRFDRDICSNRKTREEAGRLRIGLKKQWLGRQIGLKRLLPASNSVNREIAIQGLWKAE